MDSTPEGGRSLSTMPRPDYLPAHRPWQPEDVRRAHFARWLVLSGKVGDGESIEELARSRKLLHQRDGRTRPADWSLRDARQHQTRVVRIRQADETTFDPAEAGSS